MPELTITTYATLELATGEVYQLHAGTGLKYFNVFNLGPGTLYLRQDAYPAPHDPKSEMLPPGCADNLIWIPERSPDLKVITGPPFAEEEDDDSGVPPPEPSHTTITMRVVPGPG